MKKSIFLTDGTIKTNMFYKFMEICKTNDIQLLVKDNNIILQFSHKEESEHNVVNKKFEIELTNNTNKVFPQ